MVDLNNITEAYLKSFPRTNKKEDDGLDLQKKVKRGNLSAEDISPLKSRESTIVMLKHVLSKSEALQETLAREQEPVLSKTSWLDFSLLQGNGKSPEKSLVNRIKRTRTTAGACVMATEIVNPKTDKSQLLQQQAGLKALQANPNTTQQLDQAMTVIATSERMRTMMWHARSEINSNTFQKIGKKCYFRWFGLDRFNTSPNALQGRKMRQDMFANPGLSLYLGLGFILGFFGGLFSYEMRLKMISLLLDSTTYTVKQPPTLGVYLLSSLYTMMVICLVFLSPFYCLVPGILFLGCLLFPEKSMIAQTSAIIYQGDIELILGVFGIVFAYYVLVLFRPSYKHFKRTRATVNFMGFHLAGFQDLLIQAHKISSLIARTPELEAAYGNRLAKTRALLQTKTGEKGKLIYLLQKTKFRNRSYFINHTGRLLASYSLIREHKDIFADMIYEMGQLDVQLGLIKLMEEFTTKKSSNPITYGIFTDTPTHHPQLQAMRVWHPSLAATEAVPNDAAMDVKRAFFIITGPNAGGKSTYILSIGINTILNQCFGIAYAKQFNQTIFYKIITYINVIQDLARGLSLAEAGMEVLRTHKEILNRTKRPVLAIVDEILNGVDPEVAKQYSYEILKRRSPAHLNCLTLVTTHLMNLTELAKEDKRFHNKKVVVKIPGTNGRSFDYTYQIHDGVADQNVVHMMLESKGII